MSEIENITAFRSQDKNSVNWIPVYGEETDSLLDRIFGNDITSKNKVKEETYSILQLCGNPNLPTNNDTGLVLGYVQSGKTLSFTTLTAMARDNNYQLVIIIAGTSNNLVDQSYNRLQSDLNINHGFYRKWAILKNPYNPSKNPQDKNTIQRELDSWKISTTPKNSKKTLLITVMKNAKHLKNLIAILKKIDLTSVPTLIIDDEGDQASMNTKASKNAKKSAGEEGLAEYEVSAIYGLIREMKALIPHHTFLQYTATPQAPLFINLLDILSPNFVQLLTPGDKYTGGVSFFKENPYIVRVIPEGDIFSEDNPITDVPDSLLEAMRLFFLGAATGYIHGEVSGNPRNRTMMVHPSRLTDDHSIYYKWVNNVKGQWAKILNERSNDDDAKVQLINSFKRAYNDLKSNLPTLLPFDNLIEILGQIVRNTAVEELNSKSGSLVDWNKNYSFILVGGQAMDRGFTVEGLTVTYMPRNKGVGNADTLQQRARFFGYKKDYLPFCRVFLDAENAHLFSEYVDHEEDIRNKLKEHKLSGKHLNNLNRQFVLDEMFKLTRKNILSNDIERNKFGDTWIRIKAPHDNDFIIDQNKKVFQDFYQLIKDNLVEDSGHPERTEEQKHLTTECSLKFAHENFLSKLKYTRQSDSSQFTSLKAVIELYMDEFPPENCVVYVMKKGQLRQRGLNKNDEITNLFQGKNPKTGTIIYPGDDKVKDENHITIQIHNLEFKNTEYKNIISIAVWVPERLSKSLVKIKAND